MSLPRGTRLGPYEVLASLGSGGMGEVYRARDTRLGRDVALKVLRGSASADPERRRRFEQEARAASSLNHPNLLAVYDVGSDGECPYIVSELLDGESLRDRLQSGRLTVRKAVEVAVALAHGLAAAHEKGIVHRDLKPANVFLTRDGQVKILDFGLAKLRASSDDATAETRSGTTSETAPGTVVGTAAYMSPEQVRGLPVDSRSDLFALGVLLYEALSGRRPFGGETTAETLAAILKEDPPEIASLTPAVPAALDRIVKRCLEKRGEDRFHSAHDLGLALEAVSGDSGTASSPRSTATSTSRRTVTLGAAMATVLVTVGVVGFLGGRRASERPVAAFQRLTFRRGDIDLARFSPDGQTVYYGAMWDGGPIEIFSSRRDSPESRSFLAHARLLSISSLGEMAVCLNEKNTRVGTLARVPLAGGAPREVLEHVAFADWSPDGKELAVVRMEGVRSRLEFPIGTVLYDAGPTGRYIEFPRVSPDGRLVAFIDRVSYADFTGSVAIVDRTGKRTTLSEGWGEAASLAWSPDGREVWFTATKVGTEFAVHTTTLAGRERLVLRLPGLLVLHDIAKDGRALVSQIYLRNAITGLFPGQARERDLSWLDFSIPNDLSPDGTTLLFAERGEGGGPASSVYLRRTDGSPAVRLGDGFGARLSPDGKWALAVLPDRLVLLPTGAGETRPLKFEGMTHQPPVFWFPDGKRIAFAGREAGRGVRSYVVDLGGGKPRPLTPEGVYAQALSPDGQLIAGSSAPGGGALSLYPVVGGEPRAIPGDVAGKVLQWSADGRSLYLFRPEDVPAPVYRVDLSTGRKELWRELTPADPTGVIGITGIRVTPDGTSYAYGYSRSLADLYVVEGLR